MRQRDLAVVANGEECANGDILFGCPEVDVEVKISECDGLALGVLRGRLDRQLDRRRGGGGAGLRGGLTIFVGGTGEDDLAAGLRILWCSGLLPRRLGRSGLRRGGQNHHAGGCQCHNSGK